MSSRGHEYEINSHILLVECVGRQIREGGCSLFKFMHLNSLYMNFSIYPEPDGVFFGRFYVLDEVVEQSGSTQRGEKRKLSLVEPLS